MVRERLKQLRQYRWSSYRAYVGLARDRHGDSGRDLVLYVGRRVCGSKLKAWVEVVGLKDYSAVALAVKRYEERLRRNSAGERGQFERVCQLCNVEM